MGGDAGRARGGEGGFVTAAAPLLLLPGPSGGCGEAAEGTDGCVRVLLGKRVASTAVLDTPGEWGRVISGGESRPLEGKAVEGKAVEDKTVEDKTVEGKAVEGKAVEDKTVEEVVPITEGAIIRDDSVLRVVEGGMIREDERVVEELGRVGVVDVLAVLNECKESCVGTREDLRDEEFIRE